MQAAFSLAELTETIAESEYLFFLGSRKLGPEAVVLAEKAEQNSMNSELRWLIVHTSKVDVCS